MLLRAISSSGIKKIFTDFKSLMKFPKVPVLLAFDKFSTIPLKALVNVAVEGIHILSRRASESYRRFCPVPVAPATEKLPLLEMVSHVREEQLG